MGKVAVFVQFLLYFASVGVSSALTRGEFIFTSVPSSKRESSSFIIAVEGREILNFCLQ